MLTYLKSRCKEKGFTGPLINQIISIISQKVSIFIQTKTLVQNGYICSRDRFWNLHIYYIYSLHYPSISVMHSLIISGITRLSRACQTIPFTAACRINRDFYGLAPAMVLTVLMVTHSGFSGIILKIHAAFAATWYMPSGLTTTAIYGWAPMRGLINLIAKQKVLSA